MQLKYSINFIENVQDFNNLHDDDFRLIKTELKRKIYNYMTYAGFDIDGDIDLEFDMIGDDGIETW